MHKYYVHSCLQFCDTYVTGHEKIGLMSTKYTPLYYSNYLYFCVSYINSVNCIEFPILCSTSCKHFVDIPCLDTKLWNFKVQTSGQILSAHKPYILMPGHNYVYTKSAWLILEQVHMYVLLQLQKLMHTNNCTQKINTWITINQPFISL